MAETKLTEREALLEAHRLLFDAKNKMATGDREGAMRNVKEAIPILEGIWGKEESE